MKCPKCHYLSFEPEPRCRNCGYDLALVESDLTFKSDDPSEPLVDLELRADRGRTSASPAPRRQERQAAEVAVAEPPEPEPAEPMPAYDVRARRPMRRTAPRPAPTTEMPLFVKGLAPQTEPAEQTGTEIVPAAAERPRAEPRRVVTPDREEETSSAGLAVGEGGRPGEPDDHRETPERAARPAAAIRSEPRRLGTFQRELLQDLDRLQQVDQRRERVGSGEPGLAVGDIAPPTARLAAAAIDIGFLGTIAAVVFWLTLRWCGLYLGDAAYVPLLPMAAFVLLVVAGYLLLFTVAGGQTIGKMACGIRVVGSPPDDDSSNGISMRQACLRAALTIPSVLALGAGFVPALTAGGRAFHDRFAQTRVVRV